MASPSTSHGHDVEAQRDDLQHHQLEEGEIHEITNRPSEVASEPEASRAPADLEQPVVSESQDIGREGVNYDMHNYHPGPEDTTRQSPRRAEHGEALLGADTQARHVLSRNPGGPVLDSSREPRMIGDFHGSTNALWNLYGKEAKSHDEARIQPLKEDMDGVLLFAGLFSAALTSFVVDSKQNLQANPANEMVYYLRQHSTILSQISHQIASIAPQVSIPSAPPPAFPLFIPSASDVRINAFYFMALAFSLSAALLAILVQQWVRDYMHVFQRYSDLQKSARMRQYLYEGSERWYMPIAAEAVPGLLHVSVFLFFAGLADSTLNINTIIGVTTIIPISICGLLYIFITVAPVIYPQSPYQTSFSGVIWYAIQKLRGRRFLDRDGESKAVSTNMAQGQMQLSMEKTKERDGRDKRAILWLLDNLTEDAEIESFVISAAGSLEVWTELSKEDVIPVVAEPSSRLRMIRKVLGSRLIPRRFRTSPASSSSANAIVHQPELHSDNTHHSIVLTPIHERVTIREFSWRIGHFFDTCKNRALFTNDEMWRMRARACVEVITSLVFYADAELGWFGHSLQLEALRDIGSFGGIRNLSLAGRDEAFVVPWTCLSIMAIRPALKHSFQTVWYSLKLDVDEKIREIDEILEHRWKTEHEWDLPSKISFAADMIRRRGYKAFYFYDAENIDELSHRIIHEFPGVHFDFPDSEPLLLELIRDPAKLRFIACRQSPIRFFDYLKRIDAYRPNPEYEQITEKVIWPKHLLQRTFWSYNDLREGGLGFAVELFLTSLKQLLSAYPPQESHSAIYTRTLRAITSDRSRYRYSVETKRILIDVVASDQGFLRTFDYPDYITDEIWELLGDVLVGVRDSSIDRTVQQLTDALRDIRVRDRYRAKARDLISRLRSSHL